MNRTGDDEEDAATTHLERAAARRPAGDDEAGETMRASSSDDDEDGENAVTCARAAMAQQGDETPETAAVRSCAVALDLATVAGAPEESADDSEAVGLVAETQSTEDLATPDLRALAGQLKAAIATTKGDASSPNRAAEQRDIAGRARATGGAAPVPQQIGAETVTEVAPAAIDAPLDPMPQATPLDATTVGHSAAEPEVSNTATVTVATETAFDQLADGQADESSADAQAEAEIGKAANDPGDTAQGIKQTATSVQANVSLAAESRPTIAGAQATLASHRLAEFEAAARASENAALPHTPAADTSERLVQSLRLQFQRGGGDAIVQIKPEHLGPLTVSLRVENGAVSARVIADNPAVVEWLQANEHTLRDGLKANGLQLDRLVISRDQDPSGRTPHREAPESRRPPQRRSSDRQSTFEITV